MTITPEWLLPTVRAKSLPAPLPQDAVEMDAYIARKIRETVDLSITKNGNRIIEAVFLYSRSRLDNARFYALAPR